MRFTFAQYLLLAVFCYMAIYAVLNRVLSCIETCVMARSYSLNGSRTKGIEEDTEVIEEYEDDSCDV